MRRIAAIVAALMLPMQAGALGVGDIDWDSGLNQPLVAEIGLFALGSTSDLDIKVRLAPYEAYERAGIEFPSILLDLKFSVVRRQNGEPYIKVRSEKAIKDPFLDILIEIDWPSGHIIREYTILLDLPVLMDELASTVASPISSMVGVSGTDSGRSEPMLSVGKDGSATDAALSGDTLSADTLSRTSMADDAAAVAGSDGTDGALSDSPIYGDTSTGLGSGDLRYGMVKRGDTLWGIAESMQTDPSISIQQIMMALLKSNPEAFYNNNINNLKAGYVLRLDNAGMLTRLSKSEAKREAQRHFQSWMATKGQSLSRRQMSSGPESETMGVGAETGEAGPSLKLVAPDDADVAMTPKMTGESTQAQAFTSKELETLRQELSSVIEVSDAGEEENSLLRTRIAEMEEQIGEIQRLLSLRDDALSLLQLQSAVQDQVQEQPQQAVSAVPEPAATSATVADQPVATETMAKPPEQQAPAAVMTSKKPATVTPPVKPVADLMSVQGIMDMALVYVNKAIAAVKSLPSLITTTMLSGVAVVVLLIVGGIWFMRKRKISQDDLEQSMMVEVADKQLSEDMANGTASDFSAPSDEEASAVDLLETAATDNIQAELDEIDVLAEADVYLAYQRFDRAEELLREAVENEPQRNDLMVKLMEVFVASDNRDGFIEMAERCDNNGGQKDKAVWAKVVSMGGSIAAEHALFKGVTIVTDDADDSLMDDLPGADLDADLGPLDEDLLAELDADMADTNADMADSSSKELDDLDFASTDKDESGIDDGLAFDGSLDMSLDDDSTTEIATTEIETSEIETTDAGADNAASDDGSIEFDGGLDMTLDDDTSADISTDVDIETSDDGGIEFEGGLDMSPADDADVATDSAADLDMEDSSTTVDDNALDFDMESLSESDEAVSLESTTSEDDALSLDDGLADTTVDVSDDSELELQSSMQDSATDELESVAISEDELSVLAEAEIETKADNDMDTGLDIGEVEIEESGIDAELSEDIDWLTSAADDDGNDNDEADSFFSSEDEVSTKLDLIRAYIDMGDKESARNILNEVVAEGNNDQKEEAEGLLRQIG